MYGVQDAYYQKWLLADSQMYVYCKCCIQLCGKRYIDLFKHSIFQMIKAKFNIVWKIVKVTCISYCIIFYDFLWVYGMITSSIRLCYHAGTFKYLEKWTPVKQQFLFNYTYLVFLKKKEKKVVQIHACIHALIHKVIIFQLPLIIDF